MNSKHLVDPELVPILDQILGQPIYPSPTMENIPLMRVQGQEMSRQLQALAPPFPTVTVTEHRVRGPQGAPDVRVLVAALNRVLNQR